MNILGVVFFFCLAVGSKIFEDLGEKRWENEGRHIWHNIFQAGNTWWSSSAGSNYTGSFLLHRDNLPIHQPPKTNSKKNQDIINMETTEDMGQGKGILAQTPHPSPEPGCLRKDLRFEKTAAVNDFASRLELFLWKCHEIPDAKNGWPVGGWSTWFLNNPFSEIGNMSRKNNMKNLWENTTWMMTWKFDLTWKKDSTTWFSNHHHLTHWLIFFLNYKPWKS